MGRYLILALLLSFLGGWFALRFEFSPVFTEGMVGQPIDLIPGQGPNSLIDQTLERLLFRSLFVYGENGEIVPDLAESYQISADGKVYTIRLKNVLWRDGRAVSSADVAFTFTRDPSFSNVAIKQEGEQEISFVLKEPFAPFLDVLTRPIAPAHFRGLSFELLGNSRLAIKEVKQEGETVKEMRLKIENGGRIRTLRFKFYPKEQDLLQAAAVGEVDALSSDNFSDPSFNLNRVPILKRYFGLFFNLEGKNRLIGNKDFRKAAAEKTPLPEDGTPVDGPFSGSWAEGDFSFPRFDEAKSLGGFTGEISITVANSEDFPEIAQRIADSWKSSLGVEARVQVVEPAEINSILARKEFEAIILGQDVGRDPDRYNLWHSSQRDFPGQNISGYADPRADRALEEGRKVREIAVRKMHYANFQQLFFQDHPAIFLHHPDFFYWVSKKFTGVNLATIFSPEERFWNLADWRLSFEPF